MSQSCTEGADKKGTNVFQFIVHTLLFKENLVRWTFFSRASASARRIRHIHNKLC